MSSANRDDNILSRNENQRANITRGTLPTELVVLHDGNESLRHALHTIIRIGNALASEMSHARQLHIYSE